MPDDCDVCGKRYRDFRTGESFASVRELLWSPSTDPADWRYKRRNTVLGRWRQLKLELWESHLRECAYHDEHR